MSKVLVSLKNPGISCAGDVISIPLHENVKLSTSLSRVDCDHNQTLLMFMTTNECTFYDPQINHNVNGFFAGRVAHLDLPDESSSAIIDGGGLYNTALRSFYDNVFTSPIFGIGNGNMDVAEPSNFTGLLERRLPETYNQAAQELHALAQTHTSDTSTNAYGCFHLHWDPQDIVRTPNDRLQEGARASVRIKKGARVNVLHQLGTNTSNVVFATYVGHMSYSERSHEVIILSEKAVITTFNRTGIRNTSHCDLGYVRALQLAAVEKILAATSLIYTTNTEYNTFTSRDNGSLLTLHEEEFLLSYLRSDRKNEMSKARIFKILNAFMQRWVMDHRILWSSSFAIFDATTDSNSNPDVIARVLLCYKRDQTRDQIRRDEPSIFSYWFGSN